MGSYADNLAKLRQWQAEAKPIEPKASEFVEGCTGKVRHPHKDAAVKSAKMIGDPTARPYHCRHCNGWHTGHRRRWQP